MSKPYKRIEVLGLLRQVPYFVSLDGENLGALAAAAQVRVYRRGETILWEGEPCLGLYVVLRGRVRVFKRSAAGREQVLLVIGPGRTFNDVPVFDGGANPGSAAALDASVIGLLPKDKVLQFVERNSAVAMAVISVLAARMRGLTLAVEDLALRSVTARVAAVLMDAAGGRATRIETPAEKGLRLTQSQLATMTGTVREVVQRALKTLEQTGAIKLARGQITILNPVTLRQWSEESGPAP
jgi:CRP/FNR family transcriptional regulator, cyclic AMP receptor protein